MKHYVFIKVGIVLSVVPFCLLPSHSLAQSQRYIFLPLIFPPSTTVQTTSAGAYSRYATTTSSVLGAGTPSEIFTVFDPPNASFTEGLSINVNGDVTGYFNLGNPENISSFVRRQNGDITVFDAPNSSFTVSTSINDGGDVTGYFIDSSQSNKERGFLRDRNGNITVFDAPNALTTAPASINAGGNVTGPFLDASRNNKGRGFVRDRNGIITVFDAPNSSYTSPSSINAVGNVTGFFNDVNPSLGSHGFLRDQAGNVTVFDPPASVSTGSSGVNAGGDVTGSFSDASQPANVVIRGFVRRQGGNIAVFDPPNSATTLPFSINDRGDVTGMFSDTSQNSKLRGFVRDPVGNIAVFNPNTSSLTISRNINVNGVVTGSFEDDSQGKRRGFVGSSRGTIPPVTTATPSPHPNASGWNNGIVTVTLKATDPGGPGVNQILFALDGAQSTGWQTVAGNAASVTISAEGTTILGYFATDTAGNQETAKTLSVRIDKTPPTATATITPAPNTNHWNNANVRVSFTGTDSLSGIDSCSSPTTFMNEGAGQTATGACTDKAGNISLPATAKVNIDKTPPVISGLPAPGCTIWPPNHKLVQVATVTAADTLSGLAPGSFKVTGTSNDPSNGQIVITGGPSQFLVQLGADKGEVYTLTATASDLAGNAITKQATCTVPHDQGK